MRHSGANTETGEAQSHLNPRDTVLVADESPDVSAVTRRMLELLGYGVMTAGNGRQTLEMLGRYRGTISLVILDMMMFRHLDEDTRERLHNVSRDVPVLIWSGYPPEVCLQRILDQGRVDFLQKPFSMDELAIKIKQLLVSRPVQPPSA